MSSAEVDILALDLLPQDEGVLLLPSFLSLHQLQALEAKLAQRPIIFIAAEGAELGSEVQNYLSKPEVQGFQFSLDEDPSEFAAATLQTTLQANGIVFFLSGKVATRPGTSCQVPSSILRFLTQLGCSISPVFVHDPDGCSLGYATPKNQDTQLVIGESIPAELASIANFQRSLLTASAAAFNERPFLQESLQASLLRGLKTYPNANIIDGADDSEVPFSKALGVALAFSKEIRKATKKKRVGILLPPGKGGILANLAVLFANKIPVNLNFTASQQAVQSAIKQADLDKFITADPFVRKVASFPWPPNRDLIFIERVIPQIKKKIGKWIFLSKLLPASCLIKLFKFDQQGGDQEAVLLFTSGSSGAPKGVPLSHRNLLANVCQFSSRIDLPAGSKVLASLPLFHSLGCTVTMWYPLIRGLGIVTYSSPLEVKRLAELIQKHEVPLLLTTPTFLRGYIKRATKEQLSPLKFIIAGAEKLPIKLANTFEKKFGIRPLEGYGLTETSPVTNVNLPNLTEGAVIPSARDESVGQLLPGLAARITDPSTDEELPLDHPGILWLRGANIFPGYLNRDDLTEEVIQDGWFKTNDVARFDDDGFLYIEGRMSRFSKIGGEMVPHQVVETAVEKALELEDDDERKVVVVGLPDKAKGEAIGLLSKIHSNVSNQEIIDLRYKLLDAGLPSLWCPKTILPVDEIPVLASGKLDLKACQEIAKSYEG